ncbi:MAG: hypothetical protein JST15_11835 [Bacteroidetes bacterium]|nr:hypothetical protein [Bacteroidota bacterium]
MKIFFFAFAVFFISCRFAFSQLNLNADAAVSNVFRYGSGYEYTGNIKSPKEYFENLTDARLTVNGVTFGMRLEISDPIEYGLNFKGVRKRFVEYKHETGLSLRAGDYWEILSRGLSLNVFEDRPLGYDTGIDGIRIAYEKKFGKKNPVLLKTQILGGDINYSDYISPERTEKYKIRNAYAEISPVKYLTLGLSYVYSKGELPEENINTIVKTDLPEINLNFNLSDFQFYAAYSHKTSLVTPNEIFQNPVTAKGDGFYSSVSYSFDKFGLTFDYKNYRYDITLPDNRSNTRPTRMLPYQNPPTALKEHTSTLITRNPHVVDFNDEVGGQIELVYSPNEKLSFNINGSVASRHYQYEDTDPTSGTSYKRIERDNSFIPSLDDPFSPFWELYTEGEYYASDKVYFKAAFARQSSLLYNQINPLSSERISTTTIPVEVKYSLSSRNTLTFIAEQQWANNSIRIGEKTYMNHFLSLTFSRSPNINLTLNTEFTDDGEEPTGKKFWWLTEASYKINESSTALVSYGSERGGLRCSNGICRFVKPFEGFRFGVQSSF